LREERKKKSPLGLEGANEGGTHERAQSKSYTGGNGVSHRKRFTGELAWAYQEELEIRRIGSNKSKKKERFLRRKSSIQLGREALIGVQGEGNRENRQGGIFKSKHRSEGSGKFFGA